MSRTLDPVLDLWAKGYPVATIVDRTGSTPGSIYVMVHKARKRGDRRAKPRAFATRPKTHQSRGIYRTREQTQALKESVLDAWGAGADSDALAESCGIERDYVHTIVKQAREIGDPRAVRKRAQN